MFIGITIGRHFHFLLKAKIENVDGSDDICITERLKIVTFGFRMFNYEMISLLKLEPFNEKTFIKKITNTFLNFYIGID